MFSVILVGIGALALIYNYFMCQPNLQDPAYDSPSYMLYDWEKHSYYRGLSDWSGMIGTSLAGIGAILGLVAFFKTKDAKSLIAAVLGIGIGITLFLVAFGRVI